MLTLKKDQADIPFHVIMLSAELCHDQCLSITLLCMHACMIVEGHPFDARKCCINDASIQLHTEACHPFGVLLVMR